jgi:hypothetical protein
VTIWFDYCSISPLHTANTPSNVLFLDSSTLLYQCLLELRKHGCLDCWADVAVCSMFQTYALVTSLASSFSIVAFDSYLLVTHALCEWAFSSIKIKSWPIVHILDLIDRAAVNMTFWMNTSSFSLHANTCPHHDRAPSKKAMVSNANRSLSDLHTLTRLSVKSKYILDSSMNSFGVQSSNVHLT